MPYSVAAAANYANSEIEANYTIEDGAEVALVDGEVTGEEAMLFDEDGVYIDDTTMYVMNSEVGSDEEMELGEISMVEVMSSATSVQLGATVILSSSELLDSATDYRYIVYDESLASSTNTDAILYISTNKPVVITNASSSSNQVRIVLEGGYDEEAGSNVANVTLNNLTINNTSSASLPVSATTIVGTIPADSTSTNKGKVLSASTAMAVATSKFLAPITVGDSFGVGSTQSGNDVIANITLLGDVSITGGSMSLANHSTSSIGYGTFNASNIWATPGIQVFPDSTLNLYTHSDGGKLYIKGGYGCAAIGGGIVPTSQYGGGAVTTSISGGGTASTAMFATSNSGKINIINSHVTAFGGDRYQFYIGYSSSSSYRANLGMNRAWVYGAPAIGSGAATWTQAGVASTNATYTAYNSSYHAHNTYGGTTAPISIVGSTIYATGGQTWNIDSYANIASVSIGSSASATGYTSYYTTTFAPGSTYERARYDSLKNNYTSDGHTLSTNVVTTNTLPEIGIGRPWFLSAGENATPLTINITNSYEVDDDTELLTDDDIMQSSFVSTITNGIDDDASYSGSNRGNWTGIIFESSAKERPGYVYGNVVLKSDLAFPYDRSLVIYPHSSQYAGYKKGTLTIDEGVTLRSSSTIYNYSVFTNNGTFVNENSFTALSLEGQTIRDPDGGDTESFAVNNLAGDGEWYHVYSPDDASDDFNIPNVTYNRKVNIPVSEFSGDVLEYDRLGQTFTLSLKYVDSVTYYKGTYNASTGITTWATTSTAESDVINAAPYRLYYNIDTTDATGMPVTINFMGTFEILAKNINAIEYISQLSDVVFNSNAQKPEPILKDDGDELVSGKEFSLTYTNNIDAWTNIEGADLDIRPTVSVAGIGNYTGSTNLYFNITQPASNVVSDTSSGLIRATYGDVLYVPFHIDEEAATTLSDGLFVEIGEEDTLASTFSADEVSMLSMVDRNQAKLITYVNGVAYTVATLSNVTNAGTQYSFEVNTALTSSGMKPIPAANYNDASTTKSNVYYIVWGGSATLGKGYDIVNMELYKKQLSWTASVTGAVSARNYNGGTNATLATSPTLSGRVNGTTNPTAANLNTEVAASFSPYFKSKNANTAVAVGCDYTLSGTYKDYYLEPSADPIFSNSAINKFPTAMSLSYKHEQELIQTDPNDQNTAVVKDKFTFTFNMSSAIEPVRGKIDVYYGYYNNTTNIYGTVNYGSTFYIDEEVNPASKGNIFTYDLYAVDDFKLILRYNGQFYNNYGEGNYTRLRFVYTPGIYDSDTGIFVADDSVESGDGFIPTNYASVTTSTGWVYTNGTTVDEPELPSHTMVAKVATNGGTVSPASVEVVQDRFEAEENDDGDFGGSQVFSITPYDGYKIAYVIDRGETQTFTPTQSFGWDYTAENVTEDGVLVVGFEDAGDTTTKYYTASFNITNSEGGFVAPSLDKNNELTLVGGEEAAIYITKSVGYLLPSTVAVRPSNTSVTLYPDVDPNTGKVLISSDVNCNYTVDIEFQKDPSYPHPYTITVSTSGTGNGTYAPSLSSNKATYYSGDYATLTIYPNAGYEVQAILIDGEAQELTSTGTQLITFQSINADHTVGVVYAVSGSTAVGDLTITYSVDSSGGGTGSVLPAALSFGSHSVVRGSDEVVVFSPGVNSAIESVKIDGTEILPTPSFYQFTNLQTNHAIVVKYGKDMDGDGVVDPDGSIFYNINVNVGGTGSGRVSQNGGTTLTSSGSITVANGSSQSLLISPDNGNMITYISINGVSMATDSVLYDLGGIAKDTTVEVTFAKDADGDGVPDTELEDMIPITVLVPNANDGTAMGTAVCYLDMNSTETAYLAEPNSNVSIMITAKSGYELGVIYLADPTATIRASDSGSYTGTGYTLEKYSDSLYELTLSNVVSERSVVVYFVESTEDGSTPATPSEPTWYGVEANLSDSAAGYITPNSTTVVAGTDLTFEATLNENWRITSVTVNGVDIGTDSIFTVSGITKSTVILVTVEYDYSGGTDYETDASGNYSVEMSISGSGSVTMSSYESVSGSTYYYPQNSTAEITLVPNPGNKISQVLVDGAAVTVTDNKISVSMSKNRTVAVTYEFDENAEIIPNYNVWITTQNGSCETTSDEKLTLTEGDSKDIVFKGNDGYGIYEVLVNGTAIDLGSNLGATTYTYSVSNIQSSFSMVVRFAELATGGTGDSDSPFEEELDDWVQSSYSIYTEVIGNGMISFAPVDGKIEVAPGTSYTIIFSPGTNYEIGLVTLDGIDVTAQLSGSTFELTVVQNHFLVVEFVKSSDYFDLTLSVNDGGTVTLGNTALSNETYELSKSSAQTLIITPATGYEVESVKVNGVEQSLLTSVYFAVTTGSRSAQTVEVVFRLTPIRHTIYTSVVSGTETGNITPSPSIVIENGESTTIEVTAISGYTIAYLTVNNVNVTSQLVNGNQYIYTAAEDATSNQTVYIAVSFDRDLTIEPITHSIYASATGVGGTINPYGIVSVTEGQNQTFYFSASSVYIEPEPELEPEIEEEVEDENPQDIAASTMSDDGPYYALYKVIIDGVETVISDANRENYYANNDYDGEFKYTFTNITESHNIQVVFGEDKDLDGYIEPDVDGNPENIIPENFNVWITVGIGGSVNIQDDLNDEGLFTAPWNDYTGIKFTPNEGYYISQVLIDGNDAGSNAVYFFGNGQTYASKDNYYVEVIFARDESVVLPIHSIYTYFVGEGAIAPTPVNSVISVEESSNQRISVTPFYNSSNTYVIQSIEIDGVAVDLSDHDIRTAYEYQFVDVTHDHMVKVVFADDLNGNGQLSDNETNKDDNLVLFIASNEGGSVSPVATGGQYPVNKGDSVTASASPDVGNWIESVQINGVEQATVAHGASFAYTFTNISTDNIFEVTFGSPEVEEEEADPDTAKTHSIFVSATAGGSVTPEHTGGVITVEDGDSITITATADEGYYVSAVMIDSIAQSIDEGITTHEYTFSNIESNQNYQVQFAEIEDTTEPTDPGTTEPTDPGTTEPTDPGTTDPGTTDPEAAPEADAEVETTESFEIKPVYDSSMGTVKVNSSEVTTGDTVTGDSLTGSSVEIIANEGYRILSVKVNGNASYFDYELYNPVSKHTINFKGATAISMIATMSSDPTLYVVEVEFQAIQKYDVTLTYDNTKGAIAMDSKSADYGDELTATITAEDNYRVSEAILVATDEEGKTKTTVVYEYGVSNGTFSSYVFAGQAAAYELKVTFAAIDGSDDDTTTPPTVYHKVSVTMSGAGSGTVKVMKSDKSLTFATSSSTTVEDGGSLAAVFSAQTGSKVSSITINGTAIDATTPAYDFGAVNADVEIKVVFALDTGSNSGEEEAEYKIYANITGSGSVQVMQSDRTTLTFNTTGSYEISKETALMATFQPGNGNKVIALAVNGETLSTDLSYYQIETITDDVTIDITFGTDSSSEGGTEEDTTPTPVVKYDFNVTVKGDGTGSVNVTEVGGSTNALTETGSVSVAEGASVVVSFTAPAGNKITSIKVDGTSLATSTLFYMINPVNADVEIEVEFEIDYRTLSVTIESDGTGSGMVQVTDVQEMNTSNVTASGDYQIVADTEILLAFSADKGSKVESITIDGVAIDANSIIYPIDNFSSNMNVKVVFGNDPEVDADEDDTENLVTYSLNVVIDGSGTGIVTLTQVGGDATTFTASGSLAAAENSGYMLLIAADEGNVIASMTVDGVEVTNVASLLSFISADMEIAVTFNKGITNSNGDIVGSVDDDGNVYDENGDKVGELDEDGNIVDEDDNIVGGLDEDGNLTDEDGNDLDGFDDNDDSDEDDSSKVPAGDIVDENGDKVGSVDEDGNVFDKDGDYVGTVDKDGNVVDKDGNNVGDFNEDGDYYDKDDNFVGTVVPDGNTGSGSTGDNGGVGGENVEDTFEEDGTTYYTIRVEMVGEGSGTIQLMDLVTGEVVTLTVDGYLSVAEGTPVLVTFKADKDNLVDSIKVGGTSINTADGTYLIGSVTGAIEIEASFETDPATVRTISVAMSGEGTGSVMVTPFGGSSSTFTASGSKTITAGNALVVNFAADEYSYVVAIKVNGTIVTSTSEFYVVASTEDDVEIEVVYAKEATQMINVAMSGEGTGSVVLMNLTNGKNETITESGSVEIADKSAIILVFNADTHSGIVSIKINGAAASTTHTFYVDTCVEDTITIEIVYEVDMDVPAGDIVDGDGNIVGSVDDDGNVYDKDGNLVGTVDKDGNVVDKDGNIVGGFDEDGNYYDKDGELVGGVDVEDDTVDVPAGDIVDGDGNIVGSVDDDGNVYDKDGNLVGTVDPDGNVVDKDGNIVGGFDEDGNYTDKDGNIVGGLVPEEENGGNGGGGSTGGGSTGGGTTGGTTTEDDADAEDDADVDADEDADTEDGDDTTTGGTNVEDFDDVDEDDWFFEDVKYLTSLGLMNGISGDAFGPYGATTRSMMATLVYRLEGMPEYAAIADFDDVLENMWYTDGVSWGAEFGVLLGYADNTFGVAENIIRQDIAVILYRYAQLKGYNTDHNECISTFADVDQVYTYGVEAMNWAVDSGLFLGRGENNLDPRAEATRAEMAAILVRFMKLVEAMEILDEDEVVADYVDVEDAIEVVTKSED